MKDRKKRYWKRSKAAAVVKEVERVIEELRKGVVIVEGKRDREALRRLGINKVYLAAGRLEEVCKKMEGLEKVIILADLDRKGHWLAEKLSDRLWSMGVKSDVLIRKKLGRMLKVKYFEELDGKYEEFLKGEYNG